MLQSIYWLVVICISVVLTLAVWKSASATIGTEPQIPLGGVPRCPTVDERED
jgi:hypothetical protein